MEGPIIIKNKKDVYKPKCKTDTFMSCVSYWLYGTSERRELLRKKLLLHFAKICFGKVFTTITDISKAYFKGLKLTKRKNRFANMTTDRIIQFILINKTPGIISSTEIMIDIVVDYLKIDAAVNDEFVYYYPNNYPQQKTTNYISLYYGSVTRRFDLIYYSGLNYKIKTAKMYKLRVSKKNNQMTTVASLVRDNNIHSYIEKNHCNKWIYTISPIGNFGHVNNLFVFTRDVSNTDTKYVASTHKEMMNPNFVISEYLKDSTVEILAVTADCYDAAKQILFYERKLNIL